MANRVVQLNDLPEELHLLIIQFLDSEPPSSSQFWVEPSLEPYSPNNGDIPIKNLSLVSRSWRRVTLPILTTSLQFQLDLGRARLRMKNGRENAYELCLQDVVDNARRLTQSAGIDKIHNLTIIADSIIDDGLNDDGMPAFVDETIELYFVNFWSMIFRYLYPATLNIIAAPLDMALLTATRLDNVVGLLLPSELGILRLSCDPAETPISQGAEFMGICLPLSGDVLSMRPWSQIGFNVSCITLPQAAPRVAYHRSLVGLTLVKHINQYYTNPAPGISMAHPTILRKLMICTNRCPLASWLLVEVTRLVQRLELADTESVQYSSTKGWTAARTDRNSFRGTHTIYTHLARYLQTTRIVADDINGQTEDRWTVPDERIILKEVVVHDVHSPSMARDIDNIFTGLHLPVWAEHERGVYTRLITLPRDR